MARCIWRVGACCYDGWFAFRDGPLEHIGDVLEDSGCTTALTEAEVASSGTADSFLKVTHLT